MYNIKNIIIENLEAARDEPSFLEILFGDCFQEVKKGLPVILFGAGDLGVEMFSALSNAGITPAYFCDNNPLIVGKMKCGIQIISFKDLINLHRNSIIIVASQKYAKEITQQLLETGFETENVKCQSDNFLTNIIYMYSSFGTQTINTGYKQSCSSLNLYDYLIEDIDRISGAYSILSDSRSKNLLIDKISYFVSDNNFALFKKFIINYSEPLIEFGPFNYDGTPEDYYYFNNGIVSVENNEIYVDVGAYDGDTISSFLAACDKKGVKYKKIISFEPDPHCYRRLIDNTQGVRDLTNINKGLWNSNKKLSFLSSQEAVIDQAGQINEQGNIKIDVITLDDFLKTEIVTFIKMDPAGNIIPKVIEGASNTIKENKPKLAIGAYHSFNSIYEIPLQLKQINPSYEIYLRHGTYHLSDTIMLARDITTN